MSDKTGTLTENIMVLKVCAVKDSQYGWCPDDPGEETVNEVGVMWRFVMSFGGGVLWYDVVCGDAMRL